MPHLQINRVPLYYEQNGSGKEHIVFIHGMGLSHTNWLEQVPYFSSKARILTYDIRGHGRSGITPATHKPNDYIQELTADLYELLNELHIEKTFLVGYSTGTLIALQMMKKHPEKVWGSVLSGAFPKISNFYLFTKFIGSYLLGNIHLHSWLAKQVARANGATEEHIQLFYHEAQKVRWKETEILLKSCLTFNMEEQLSSIEIPTLLLYGGNERHMMKYRHQLLTHIPNAEACLIPKINHACPTKGRDAFNLLVENFFELHKPKKSDLLAFHTNQYESNAEQYPHNLP